MSRRRASDVMTTDVVTVYEHTGFKEIAKAMAEAGVSGLPVLGVDKRVVGVVTEGDLIRKEEFKDEARPPRLQSPHQRHEHAKAAASTARDLMSAPAVTVEPSTSLVEVVRQMLRHDIKRTPVADADGRLLGIVSRADVLKVFCRDDAEIAHEVDKEIMRPYFRGEPVHVRVHDGVVTLDGQIEQKSLIPLAVRLTQSVDGVVDVIDHLSYAVDDTHAAEAAHLPYRPPTPTPRF